MSLKEGPLPKIAFYDQTTTPAPPFDATTPERLFFGTRGSAAKKNFEKKKRKFGFLPQL